MYWLQKLDKMPPHWCRLVARHPHLMKRALTTEQIAKRSGLSKQTVLKLSKLRSWGNVTISQMESFKFGCGVIPGKEAIHRAYVERTKKTGQGFYHLRRLMKQKKDQRIERFLVALMLPKIDE